MARRLCQYLAMVLHNNTWRCRSRCGALVGCIAQTASGAELTDRQAQFVASLIQRESMLDEQCAVDV